MRFTAFCNQPIASFYVEYIATCVPVGKKCHAGEFTASKRGHRRPLTATAEYPSIVALKNGTKKTSLPTLYVYRLGVVQCVVEPLPRAPLLIAD